MPRHVQVEEHELEVGMLLDEAQGLLGVRGLEDLRLLAQLHQHVAETLSEERVVVADQDLHGPPPQLGVGIDEGSLAYSLAVR